MKWFLCVFPSVTVSGHSGLNGTIHFDSQQNDSKSESFLLFELLPVFCSSLLADVICSSCVCVRFKGPAEGSDLFHLLPMGCTTFLAVVLWVAKPSFPVYISGLAGHDVNYTPLWTQRIKGWKRKLASRSEVVTGWCCTWSMLLLAKSGSGDFMWVEWEGNRASLDIRQCGIPLTPNPLNNHLFLIGLTWSVQESSSDPKVVSLCCFLEREADVCECSQVSAPFYMQG